jgi:hypothetical protein
MKSGGYLVLCSSANQVLGASGHHHLNYQKYVGTSASSGKSRGTRLSKNSVDCSSDDGAESEI